MSERSPNLTLKFLAEPTDVNFGGKVARRHRDEVDRPGRFYRGGRVERAVLRLCALGGIRFVAPVRISDLVTVSARLVRTGRTSMHFGVGVRARNPMGGDDRLCTHCIIVFVAVDRETGAPVEVPSWTPVSDKGRHLFEYAEKVMALSKDIEEKLERYAPEG